MNHAQPTQQQPAASGWGSAPAGGGWGGDSTGADNSPPF